ncbi:transglycosylase domain-containing protein [Glycomyces arizonensis]|uniref:transglycosylase domain-containing protein n=1 Tax=Glycomyces arizonensis TaxID=256035 RepID=UPI000409143F|nr:transglycosylase domain-containing protein [Glycomyces arizonensis]
MASDSIDSFESLPTELTQPTLPQTSYVYASDGETLITSFYEENRREVSLDEVDPLMIDALLAAEDSKFYEHSGVDWAGIVRAAVANQSGDTQGASTLTMQFVRNTLIYSASTIDEVIEASEDTYERKLREARYALAIEDEMSKEEILEGYLNVIYLGNQAYGINAGSYTYFNKPPTELELHEAATLASLPKFPSYADGLLDGEGDDSLIVDRRNWVLDRMASLDMVSQAEADEAKAQPLGLNPRETRSECVDVATANWGFFCDYFKEWWASQELFGETERDRLSLLKRGGFRIVTSLDPDLQSAAMDAIHDEIDDDDPRALGSVAITPGTGHVRSMAVNRVYSLDQSGNGPRTDGEEGPSNYPNTTIPLLSGNDEVSGFPAGSTFKMFTMLAALEQGWPLKTTLSSPKQYTSQYTVGEGADEDVKCNKQYDEYNNPFWNWCPTTEGYSANQLLDFWGMFGKSSNTAFVQLQEMIGTSKAVEMAERLGIDFGSTSGVEQARHDAEDAEADPDDFIDEHYGVFTLGMADNTTPLDMAEAYATVAAGGLHCDPLPVMKVITVDGEEWAEASAPSCEQVIDEDVALAAVSAAHCPVYDNADKTRCVGGTAREADGFGRPVIGKTGTANADRSYWFIGSTPNATTATFVGDPDNSANDNLASGFHEVVRETGVDVLQAAVEGLDEKGWSAPSDEMINGEGLVSIPGIGCEDPGSAKSRVASAGFDVSIAPGKFDSECKEGQAFSTSVTGSAPEGSPIYILVSNGSGYEEPAGDEGGPGGEGGGNEGGPGGDNPPGPGND